MGMLDRFGFGQPKPEDGLPEFWAQAGDDQVISYGQLKGSFKEEFLEEPRAQQITTIAHELKYAEALFQPSAGYPAEQCDIVSGMASFMGTSEKRRDDFPIYQIYATMLALHKNQVIEHGSIIIQLDELHGQMTFHRKDGIDVVVGEIDNLFAPDNQITRRMGIAVLENKKPKVAVTTTRSGSRRVISVHCPGRAYQGKLDKRARYSWQAVHSE